MGTGGDVEIGDPLEIFGESGEPGGVRGSRVLSILP